MSGPSYSIDDGTLREVLVDPVAVQERVLELTAEGPSGDAERIGWLRMLGRLEEAEALGWRSLAAAGGPQNAEQAALPGDRTLPLAAVAAALRLAHVLQWQRRFAEADALFRAGREGADAAARSAEPGTSEHRKARALQAFARQHAGKSMYDQGRYHEALGLFTQALALRLGAGAPAEQVASSRQAVYAAAARLRRR